jgi:hypothetical protein
MTGLSAEDASALAQEISNSIELLELQTELPPVEIQHILERRLELEKGETLYEIGVKGYSF